MSVDLKAARELADAMLDCGRYSWARERRGQVRDLLTARGPDTIRALVNEVEEMRAHIKALRARDMGNLTHGGR